MFIFVCVYLYMCMRSCVSVDCNYIRVRVLFRVGVYMSMFCLSFCMCVCFVSVTCPVRAFVPEYDLALCWHSN